MKGLRYIYVHLYRYIWVCVHLRAQSTDVAPALNAQPDVNVKYDPHENIIN